MDKRKMNGGGVEDLDDRAAKRRKLPTDHIDLSRGETAETTTALGLKLIDTVKNTADKSGRTVADAFHHLPSRRELPDYYEFTKMPIALDTIEGKLKRHEFPNLTTLESYFKRMIQNAKEYNEKGSQVYDDAERIRKALSNFMTKTNPAYKLIPGYVAFPTPLPGQVDGAASDEDADGEPDPEIEAASAIKKRGRPPKNPQAQRSSATPALSERSYAGVSFEGLTFQQAQEKIVEDLIRQKESPEEEYAEFEVFVDLPPRSLRDYYQIILTPMSLKKLQKKVKGIDGKNGTAGISDFKTWAAFEEEASYIWKNAWHYNEDSSEISNLAKDLQASFYKQLKEAKEVVSEPVGPKIKLKLPEPAPKITLKFGKSNPADSPAPQANGSNGTPTPVNGTARKNPFGGSHSSATPVPSLDHLGRARSTSNSVDSPTPSISAPVKNEEGARNSPAVSTGLNPYRASSQSVSTQGVAGVGMPPPSTPGVSNPNLYSSSGYAQSFPHQPQYQPPNPSVESKWRKPGQNASDAMITNLSLATHPGLNITRHLRMDVPPSPTMTHQSITVNLPSTHYYLQIKPTIAASLFERQYKLFVTSGTQRLHAMPTIPHHNVDQRCPLFEARLTPGVNRIEIELIAALPKGAKPTNGQDFELEKITVFANLLK